MTIGLINSKVEFDYGFLLFVQVCSCLWRRRVHHLHSHGSEEQELWQCTGVCLGSRFFRVSVLHIYSPAYILCCIEHFLHILVSSVRFVLYRALFAHPTLKHAFCTVYGSICVLSSF